MNSENTPSPSTHMTREQQIVAMAKVLDDCRWFKAPDTGMEVKSLVLATRLWDAANQAPEPNAQSIVTTIDTMREAAKDVLVKCGWKPGSTLGFQNITGLMAEFGMQVYRGEIGCDYPNCGCCADAACEDAINQHPDLGGTPPQTREMGS